MATTPLLIVTGPPASGTATLARRLARDAFMERLFDTLGRGDREHSKEIGAASDEILWLVPESNLAAGIATMVESNFRGDVSVTHFRELAAYPVAAYPVAAYPIAAYHPVNCFAAGRTLLRRHHERSHAGERHPGHGDQGNA